MDSFALTELTPLRKVFDIRFNHGPYGFESKRIELNQYGSEYYLLYWHDPLPGEYGDDRCEGIVHIHGSDVKKDDNSLANVYFHTKINDLINMSLHQERMTLTYLSAAYCADKVCFVYCSSARCSPIHAGCIEFTRDEMQMMTVKKLRSVLRKANPKGTVIPSFKLYRSNDPQ